MNTPAGAHPAEAPFIGVLMLDTKFHRYPGDIGNPESWSTPVRFKIVHGARPAQVVFGDPSELLEPFIAAGLELVAEGARAITTSCGFLAVFQRELAEALPVPVFTSSLLQIPMIEIGLPKGTRAGILTFSAESLGFRHLKAVGAPLDTPIQGLPKGSLFAQYYGDQPCLGDLSVFDEEVVAAAKTLVARHPEVGAILCECTNLPRHSKTVSSATGLPVFDVMTMLNWLGDALGPNAY
ncbi:aspartate/glutamate racemase family protein [Devosia sp. 2618]|uniref:aspartate/glutamate racemase family protein n=1 Tax=Devosia sp. 2618 TaxID=3156454 RepID=UPI003394B756